MNKHISLVGALSNREYFESQVAQLEEQLWVHLDNLDAVEEEIRSRVKGGETTGDPISDMLLVASGCINEGVKAQLRVLDALVGASKGRPVLRVVCNLRETSREDYYDETVELYLGILSGSPLVVDIANGNCFLPIEKEVYTEDFSFGSVQASNEPTGLLTLSSVESHNHRHVRILIGFMAIVDFFREEGALRGTEKLFDVFMRWQKRLDWSSRIFTNFRRKESLFSTVFSMAV